MINQIQINTTGPEVEISTENNDIIICTPSHHISVNELAEFLEQAQQTSSGGSKDRLEIKSTAHTVYDLDSIINDINGLRNRIILDHEPGISSNEVSIMALKADMEELKELKTEVTQLRMALIILSTLLNTDLGLEV